MDESGGTAEKYKSSRATHFSSSRLNAHPPGENVTSTLRKAVNSPVATTFKSFLVTNQVPSPPSSSKPKAAAADPPAQKPASHPAQQPSTKPTNHIVCEEEWFVLKKFQLKKLPEIDDSKLPRNVRRVMEKMNEDNFI